MYTMPWKCLSVLLIYEIDMLRENKNFLLDCLMKDETELFRLLF